MPGKAYIELDTLVHELNTQIKTQEREVPDAHDPAFLNGVVHGLRLARLISQRQDTRYLDTKEDFPI